MKIYFVFLCLFQTLLYSEDIPKIERRIPPVGKELNQEETKKKEEGLTKLKKELNKTTHALKADAEIYYKAVRYALDHNEFYAKKNNALTALYHIEKGLERTKALQKNETPWTTQKGMVVRGYRSPIDGSVQPIVIEIPEN